MGSPLEERFHRFFVANKEKGYESVSGIGSSLHETRGIRAKLPALFEKLSIKTIVDAPCGDCNWFRHTDYKFHLYIGVDIVSDLVNQNREMNNRPFNFFETADITKTVLPKVDAIFCRDCLVHLSNDLVQKALENFAASRSTYLITTHFLDVGDEDLNSRVNIDMQPGSWRPVSLTRAPFCLPEPLELLDEESKNRFAKGKTLSVWRIPDLMRGLRDRIVGGC
jgi:hypothetical protein